MREKKNLTVFTPTFNRGYILSNLYQSLKRQTNKDFIWLIVDDGSVDDTGNLVHNWICENNIEIEYIYQENKGKSQAHNEAVKRCVTKWFTCVDSDDYLEDKAIETIINNFDASEEASIGFSYMRRTFDGELISKWPAELSKATLYDAYQRYGATGDTMLVYKTEIIKKHSFPQFEGEKFVPEAYLYDQLDDYGYIQFVHEAIYICEYLDDGYTKSMFRVIKENPEGYLAYIKQRIKKDKRMIQLLGDTIRYCAISISAKKRGIVFGLDHKGVTLLMFPWGYLLYLKRYRNI